MGLYFGTDGLRGVVGEDLSFDMVYRCGRALAKQKKDARILIGRDTRLSGDFLTLLFSLGAMSEGASIEDVRVCPTAGISYLTKICGFDFGVVVSASHNPSEYNGIKIFDSEGNKLGDFKESLIEKNFFICGNRQNNSFGQYKVNSKLIKLYEEFLINKKLLLSGKKIILDCANGASYEIAPKVFKSMGADVIVEGNNPDGKNINQDCGAMHIENLQNAVLNNHADFGFAFDGDSDRILAVDEKGNIIDGDMIVYLFACEYQKKGLLLTKKVVGTLNTNAGIELALKEKGIDFVRTDVGDKYVNEYLEKEQLLIGGEQCGHVLVKDKLATGDGILNAVLISEICVNNNKKLSQFFNLNKFEQVVSNIKVKNKKYISECIKNNKYLQKIQNDLKINERLVVRPSGTESLIRILVEGENVNSLLLIAQKLKDLIINLDKEI